MLSITLPMHGVGHANYYIELAQKDYYTAQGNDPGAWFGRGATKLGLTGEVDSQAYAQLLWGRSPDGRRELVQNAGDAQRQTAWDLTFSAPKSVSVLWALGSDDVRGKIETAHRQAVEAALSFLEETTGLTRRGKGGARMESADLVFALFPHYSSRAFDPQVHTHALLINLAVRQDGTTGALWSKEFFRAKMAAGAVYQVQFAAGLREGLGLVTEPARIGFQIAAVPKEVCRAFSQRGEAIRAVLDERQSHDARTAKQVTLDTRPHKVNVARAELTARWRTKAEPLGWNAERVSRLLHQGQVQPCAQRDLEQRFHEAAARLPAQQRTPGRLRGLAAAVAIELGADARQFRPLLRFVPGRPHEQPLAHAGEKVIPVSASAQRHTESPVSAAPRPAESGKFAGQTRRGEPAVSHRETLTERSSTKTQTPGSDRHKPKQPPVRQTTQSSQEASRETTSAPAQPNPPAHEVTAPKSSPSQPAGPGARKPTQPEPASLRTDDHRPQPTPAAEPDSTAASSRRGGQHHSRQQRSQSQRQREQADQAGRKAGRSSHQRHRQERHQRRRPAQPHEKGRVERNAELLAELDPRQATTLAERKHLFFAWKEVMANGKADELFGPDASPVPRRQAKRNRQFARAFEDKVVPIPAAAQTRQRLTFHAVKLAAEHLVTPRALYQTLRQLRPGAERGLVSVEWRRLFPKAPKWSPARYWKAPVVVLGHASPKPRKWGAVRWQQRFLFLEARVQQRRLFPKAPKWSPVRNWSLPALRLIANGSSSTAATRPEKTRQKKDKDQSQSQSQ
jgi:conjugative relaxase-like TrwC/TraI family protein